jgi:hypothetical protein
MQQFNVAKHLEVFDGSLTTIVKLSTTYKTSTMAAHFRAKKLDIGSFINKWVIRDHTKRKVYQEYEAERYVNGIGSVRTLRQLVC